MLNHKTIKTIGTIILLAMGFIFAGGRNDKKVVQQTATQEIDTTKLEKYERKVIIDAKWGSGPGEIKLEPLPESYEYMTCFTVAPNGDIYIADPNNRRINVYNQNSEFLKEIKVPKEFLTWIGDDTIATIEAIGVDSKGYIYMGSSTAYHSRKKNWGQKGEIILKIDIKGELVNEYVFEGAYVYPLVFYETADGEIYLWGNWAPYFVYAFVPLRIAEGKSFTITDDYLIPITFSRENSIKVGKKEIKIASEMTPSPLGISKNDEIVAYIGNDQGVSCFIFQDVNGKMLKKLPFHRLRHKYYEHGWRFPYKTTEYGVALLIDGVFDRNLNYYEIIGTPTHLQVIKYVLEEVWK